MALRLGNKALLELDLGELQMALSERELARRAAHGAVALGLLRELFEAGDLSTQSRRLRTGCGCREDCQHRNYESRAELHRPAPRWASRASRMAFSAYTSLTSARSVASL